MTTAPPIFDGLAGVEVINLARRPDRLAAFREEITSVLGSEAYAAIHVREAVDGLCLVLTPELREILGEASYAPRRGDVACCLSHALLWAEAAVADGPVLVFEDDVTLAPDFSATLPRLLAELEERFPSWDLVFLGFYINWDPPGYGDQRPAHVLAPMCWGGPLPPWASSAANRYMGGTFSYLVSPGGAKRLLELVDATGFRHPIDMCLLDWQDELCVLEAIPRLVLSEYAADTDIRDDPSHLGLH